MAPTLYMTPLSPPSRGVLMTAQALNLSLDLKTIDLTRGENRSPEYTKLNPLHTVPTLVDGNVIITDSHAINAYLVGKYAKNDNLYPTDCAKRALVDQRLHFDSARLFNQFRTNVGLIFYRKRKDVEQEEAAKIEGSYEILEKFLTENEWIAGDDVTIADVSLATSTTALSLLVPLKSEKYPKVDSWLRKFHLLEWSKANEPGFSILKETIKKCQN